MPTIVEPGFGSRSQRGAVERHLAELDRASRLTRVSPAPPREVKGAGTILSWRGPHPSSTGPYTHFRVYSPGDGDNRLVRQLPADQLFLSDGLEGVSIFVSTFNATTGAESSRIPMVGALTAAVAPPITSADSDIYTYPLTSTGITLISYAAPAKDGDFLTVDIRIPTGVPPTNIYWIEWGGTFDLDVPTGLNDVPGARNLFFFTSIGLKWTMLSYRGYVPE